VLFAKTRSPRWNTATPCVLCTRRRVTEPVSPTELIDANGLAICYFTRRTRNEAIPSTIFTNRKTTLLCISLTVLMFRAENTNVRRQLPPHRTVHGYLISDDISRVCEYCIRLLSNTVFASCVVGCELRNTNEFRLKTITGSAPR